MNMYRERFDNVIRVLDEYIGGGNQFHGRKLNLSSWDLGNSGCIMGLCMLDPWFMKQGFGPIKDSQAVGCGCSACEATSKHFMPAYRGHTAAKAVVAFLALQPGEFDLLFCYEGYEHYGYADVNAKLCMQQLQQYMIERFEGAYPRLRGRVLQGLIAQSAPTPIVDMIPPPAMTWQWHSAPLSASFTIGETLKMSVPTMPTSPPFSPEEVELLTGQLITGPIAAVTPKKFYVYPPPPAYPSYNTMPA